MLFPLDNYYTDQSENSVFYQNLIKSENFHKLIISHVTMSLLVMVIRHHNALFLMKIGIRSCVNQEI